MITFVKNYSGSETGGVKFRRGAKAAFHAWQEDALIEQGVAVYVKPKAPKAPKAPKKKPDTE